MKEFSKPQYKVDVLKVEVPVNMNYVAGFAKGEAVYTKEEADEYFKAQSDATHLPFIFLSAGYRPAYSKKRWFCQSRFDLQWRLVRPGNVERWC